MFRAATALLLVLLCLAVPARADVTTIATYDFSSGAQGWGPRGDGVVLDTSSGALRVTGRTQNWMGAQITPPFEKGVTYTVTARVSGAVALTVERTPAGGSTTWERVGAATSAPGEFTELSGTYGYSADSTLNLYFESADATAEFTVDDIVVTSDGDPTQSGLSTDFETGTAQGWNPRGGAALTASGAAAHAGAFGLAVTNRQASWDGPSLNVLGKLAKGAKYTLSVWVRSAEAQSLGLSIERRQNGTPSYERVVAPASVTGWTRLTGTYTLAHDVDFLSVYVESAEGVLPFEMDDFTLEYVEPKPIQTDIPSLKDTVPFTLGAAFHRGATLGEHAKLINKHYGSVTPGNALKWDATEPAEGRFTFDEGDALVDFATGNGLEFRGHTLVWHSQTPAWVFEGATKEVLLQRVENHIRAVMGRYKGRIGTWDVVNEVIDENQPDGLRRSPWFEITGLDYIRTAFRVAREVDPAATLVFNDYNTEFPRKREAMYKVVKQLRDEGVPIDAVGHQLHVNIEQPPAYFIEDTIERFATLGVEQQVTELDVSVYTDFVSTYPTVPADVLARQGHRYKEIFDVFRRQAAKLSSVTIWGVADDETWLSTFPINRVNAPLPFDDELQAKPAFWGVADPSKLPASRLALVVPAGTVTVDGKRDPQWDRQPDRPVARVGAVSAAFQLRKAPSGVYVFADVTDTTDDTTDSLTLKLGSGTYKIQRGGTHAQGFKAHTRKTDGGWQAEALLPSGSASTLDLTVDDAATGPDAVFSGTLTFVPEVKEFTAPKETPVVDGVAEAVWNKATPVDTGTWIQGTSGATAKVRALWSPSGVLYVLAKVTDPVLSEESPNAWEEDSVEIFVDPENNKTKGYDDDDGQYRISFTGAESIGGTFDAFAIRGNLTSAVSRTSAGYVVEAAIKLPTVTLSRDRVLGFDVQINDATGAARTAAVTWHDPTGQSYLSTARWGVLRLGK
ncbi:1,4-beta-xylanase [Herbidospora sp. NEAU-GS84]|uniref:Beta-xylanase n=1 Tax=Herbidospora solisilvae TaxID=2696284 RepID=A0A7C9MZT0_9ACTN|nr:endo-1,4-beta-xylanase [Herbidospora solisilvae]NAS21549.1 1,4-beta-xylanase [Herbidospora solisilvae]